MSTGILNDADGSEFRTIASPVHIDCSVSAGLTDESGGK